jgi:putative sterol carrier protein
MGQQQKDQEGKFGPAGQQVSIDLPALAGVSGRMRVDVKDEPQATIHLDHGRVWATEPEDDAEAVAVVQERSDFEQILAGELNPVVASIQGRLALRGDPELGTRLISALNAAKPFARREGKA